MTTTIVTQNVAVLKYPCIIFMQMLMHFSCIIFWIQSQLIYEWIKNVLSVKLNTRSQYEINIIHGLFVFNLHLFSLSSQEVDAIKINRLSAYIHIEHHHVPYVFKYQLKNDLKLQYFLSRRYFFAILDPRAKCIFVHLTHIVYIYFSTD